MISSPVKHQDELVLVGVIGSKLVPRRSRNDRIYSVWCLSDLNQVGPGSSIHGCVKLFLFGNCHEKLWKEPEGTVIAVLGPRLMQSAVSFDDKDLSITLKSDQHLMILGHSPDYALCSATAKSGQPCFRVVNKSVCRYCDLHVKKAYYEASSSRPGFFDFSLSGMNKPKRRRYTGDLAPRNGTSLYSLPIASASAIEMDQPKFPTSRVNLNVAKLSAAGYSVDSAIGLAMNSTTSSQQSNSPVILASTSANSSGPSTNTLTSPERKLLKSLRRPTAGSLNLLRHLQSGLQQSSGSVSQSAVGSISDASSKQSVSTKPSVSRPSSSGIEKSKAKSGTTFTEFFASIPEKLLVSSKRQSIESDGFIDLGPRPVRTSSAPPPALSAARLRATALVRSRGGLKAMERETKLTQLNTVLEKQMRNKTKQKNLPLLPILSSNMPSTFTTRPTQSPAGGTENTPPPSGDSQNRARLERLAALAKHVHQGSAHAALVTEVENVDEQIRLSVLEKRDEMEQRLANQTEEACTIAQCHTCRYRAWTARPECRKSGHQLTFPKAIKRYFCCRNCSKRTVTFEKYPRVACTNCGESLFQKTGIIKERKVPNLPNEKLLPRGLEEKFL